MQRIVVLAAFLWAGLLTAQTLTPGQYLRWGGGTYTTNDCVKIDAFGRAVSAGAACGAGGGGTVTGGANVGGGAVTWFKDLSSGSLRFQSLAVTTPITVTGPTADLYTVACPTCIHSGGSYADPAWITSLAYGKLTGVPSFVPTTRTVGATSPLAGGGALSGDLTLTCTTCEVTTAKNAANGYAGLSGSSKVTASQVQEVLALADLTNVTAIRGNGTTVQMATGSTTDQRCAKFDVDGNLVDAGKACGDPASAASGIVVTGTPAGHDIATDSTVVPEYMSGSGAPSANCTAGRHTYLNTANGDTYDCTAANTWTRRLKSGGITDADIPDTITVSNYLPLAGGTMSGQLIAHGLGVEFAESDTNPACAAGNYNIFADTSETKLKKCTNGTVSDLDTTGGGGGGFYRYFHVSTRTGTTNGGSDGWHTNSTSGPAVGAFVTGATITLGVFNYDPAADEAATLVTTVPSSWTSQNITVKLRWAASTNSTTSAIWSVETACVGDGEDLDGPPTFNAAQTVTDANTGNGFVNIATLPAALTMTGCAADELLLLRVSRDADNGSDDLAVDAGLLGISLSF